MTNNTHKIIKHNSRKTKKNNSRKTKKYNFTKKYKHRNNKKLKIGIKKGGSINDCSIASVKEPGFNIPILGDISGLSIPESRGAIYRPNCKTDTYQAMTP